MKIVSLNIWHGRIASAFERFLEKERISTDIFCFQEVASVPDPSIYLELKYQIVSFQMMQNLLPDFRGVFVPFVGGEAGGDKVGFGSAMFVKKSVSVASLGEIMICEATTEDNLPRHMQFARLECSGQPYTVCHAHGVSLPSNKLDTPARLEQSRRMVEFIKGEKGEVILSGDLNLLPETKSIALFEEAGLRNLIKEYHIERTRGKISEESFDDRFQPFADYCFVTPGVKITSFTVPLLSASDHLPLILEVA